MPQPIAPATTSEQFATAVRNAALHEFNAILQTALGSWSRVGPLHAPAVFLDDALAALAQCVDELERADRFAPDKPADRRTLGFLNDRHGW